MRQLYLLLFAASTLLLGSCTKEIILPGEPDVYEWMRNHEKATVVYVDYYSGNYIVETYRGYSVIEDWGGSTPREYDIEFAHFSSRGVQTTYNRTGNYFTQIRVVDYWLSWDDALYVLDQISTPYNK